MNRLSTAQILLLFTALTLGACAAPRYQTAYRYEPPGDPAGRACLSRCEADLKRCRDDCAARYSSCVESVEPEAKQRHADALKRYAGALEQYRRDVDRYHLNLSIGWGHYHDRWFGGGWYDPWPFGYGPYDYYPPLPPVPPRYEEVLAKLRAERCDRDCACQPGYDACFTSCGGNRIPERRCVANCPRGS